jgi:formate dehydrogenase major subunit
VDFIATPETTTPEFPFLLTTGRTLYQFNAGTMTMRTLNTRLRGADTLDMAPDDATRLNLPDAATVRVRSRHGEVALPLRIDPRIKPGELFATFHAVDIDLNRLTGPHRDMGAMTPEYKVVAVNVSRT